MMSSPLDFNAALGEQLRDAAEQMRAMRKPQKKQDKDVDSARDAAPGHGQPPQDQGDAAPAQKAQAVTAVAVEGTATKREDATDSVAATTTGGATVPTTDAVTVGVTSADSVVTSALTPAAAPAVTGDATPAPITPATPDATVAPTPTASATQAVSRETLAPAQLRHTPTAGQDKIASPELPDAASELWAMSQHSATPTLSERSWSGGVRGAVLDALRLLAGDNTHVLVNLKRLATHTGISYGSVRNAMSRLTRSGDIRTRQIRMADGHGVRVEFLTPPGQEGLAPAAGGEGAGYTVAPTVAQAVPLSGAATGVATGAGTGAGAGALADAATVAQAVGQAVTPPAHNAAHSTSSSSSADFSQPGAQAAANAFWQTTGQLFALAWPHVAEAGLGMDDLRALAPIFAVQGFDATVLPRCLRYLDWELEHLQADEQTEARRKDCVNLFMRGLQRRGSWPRPKDYPEEA